nr:hypothetical protein [Pedobacter kyonggii]
MHVTTCTECEKRTDGLTTCYINLEISDYLCPECIENSSYCMGCGNFSTGIESFDFSEIKGYCENCVDEIKSDSGEDDEFDDDVLDYGYPYPDRNIGDY